MAKPLRLFTLTKTSAMRYLLSTGILFFFFQSFASKLDYNSINPIIGNESFVQKFGFEPSTTTDDQVRIQTHLSYVERVLKKKNTAHLNKEQRKSRKHLINLLREYWQAGIFPKNKDHLERRPCFIDNEGNICAVGYLVEQTAGRRAAAKINKSFKYATIDEMGLSSLLEQWIAESGLSKEEVAMIQPGYRYEKPKAYLGFTHAASVLSVGALTISSLGNNSDHWLPKSAPYIGLASGLSQTYFGYTNLRSRRWQPVWSYSYHHYDGFNIGLGLATTFVSSYQLINRRRKSIHQTSFFSPSTFTLPENQLAMGFQFVKRF